MMIDADSGNENGKNTKKSNDKNDKWKRIGPGLVDDARVQTEQVAEGADRMGKHCSPREDGTERETRR